MPPSKELRLREVSDSQFSNMLYMSSTWLVLKRVRSTSVILQQPENIRAVLVRLSVSMSMRRAEVRLVQPENIPNIVVTLLALHLLRFTEVSDVQP